MKFNDKELEDFLYDYCNNDGSGSYIYLMEKGIYMKTSFDIEGRRWQEIELILEAIE